MAQARRALSASGPGAELRAPLAKLFEATDRAFPLVCSALVDVLFASVPLGDRDERLKDTIKALTVYEAVEQEFGALIAFGRAAKTRRTCFRFMKPT